MELAAYFGEDVDFNGPKETFLIGNNHNNHNKVATTRLCSFDRIVEDMIENPPQEFEAGLDFEYPSPSSIEFQDIIQFPTSATSSPSSISSPSSPYSPCSPDSELNEILQAEQNPRKGGRKQGSTIYCDTELIHRLLPLSTKKFNQEIKALSLTDDEVSKLKFARRRIKNARAAQKRRHRTSESLKTLQTKVQQLLKERADFERKLKAALVENDLLRAKIGNS